MLYFMFDNFLLIGVGLLLFVSILQSKLSDLFSIPALLLFLITGMLLGSDGLGFIKLNNPALAQSIGVIALMFIMFSGGLGTKWNETRPAAKEGLLLATIGVLIAAVIISWIASVFLGLTLLESLLLASIISSTDAPTVFSILRSKNIHLKGRLKLLLELESGSNDPMAIFLTTAVLQSMTQPQFSFASMLVFLILQILVGAIGGFLMAKLMHFFISRLRLGYEGLYPLITLAFVLLTFGITDQLGGSGFLAVYLAGIVLGNCDFKQRENLLRFHDSIAWLMQIVLFLTLGALVSPLQWMTIWKNGLLLAASLMLFARPISVFISLPGGGLTWREKTFVSWVGLRGAVPIILATFPLIAGVSGADLIFHFVFITVLTSMLLQGVSIPFAARWLQVAESDSFEQ